MLFNKKCVRPSHTNYHTRYGENYDLTPRFSYPLSIVIVDTTVAPALYVVGQYYSWALSIRIRIFLNPRNFSFADLGCVACVSGNFRSKERPRSGIFGFDCARNETRAKKWKIVIVDTTVAPALYVVGQYYSWALSIRIRIFLNPRNFSFADLGCVACVSGNFRSKERPRSGIFGFGCARNETRAKKWKRGWGGKGRKLLPHPLPPSAIFRAVFGSRSSFFSPKPHGNAHYAGYCGFGFRPNKCYFCDSGYRPIHLHFVPTVTKRISQPRFKAVWHAGRRYSISCLGRWKGKIQYRSFPFLSCRIVTHNKCHSSLI